MTLSEYLIEAVATRTTGKYKGPLNTVKDGDDISGDEYGRLMSALEQAGAMRCMKRVRRDIGYGRDYKSVYQIYDTIMDECGNDMGYATLLYEGNPCVFILDRKRSKDRDAYRIVFSPGDRTLISTSKATLKTLKASKKGNRWIGKDNTEWVPNNLNPYGSAYTQVHVPRMFASEINDMILK